MADLPSTYGSTRRALHPVAEHVLGAARYRAEGRIALRVVVGGFATPPFASADGSKVVAVTDGAFLVHTDQVERRVPLTSIRELAEVAGVEPGAPEDVYAPATALDLDASLDIDPLASRVLTDWFVLVDQALSTMRSQLADWSPTAIALWPEHFDDAFDAGEVNFGGSPGDADHDEPYLYVGPWTPRPGSFWNEPFGASCSWSDVGSLDDALSFLRTGAAQAMTSSRSRGRPPAAYRRSRKVSC